MRAEGQQTWAVALPKFAGVLTRPTQPHTIFLQEFSDRVRVVACIDTLPNLICSTSETATLSSGEWEKVEKACGVEHGTPVMVVWGAERDVQTAVQEILIRARDAVEGVPSETRQALPDGTNGFERILPGADRMYPDTDLPPIPLESARVENIRAALPSRPWEKTARAREMGVGADLAERLGRHRAWTLFEHLAGRLGDGSPVTPHALASILMDRSCPRPASLAAAGDWWDAVLDRLQAGEILAEALWSFEDEPAARLADDEAKRRFDEAVAGADGSAPDDPALKEHWLMGQVMPALRGRVAGATVRNWVKEVLA